MSNPHLHLVTGDEVPTAPLPEAPRAWSTGHDVQFYDNEEFLYASVATFLADGIHAGQPLVVISTRAHRGGFTNRLRAKGIDVDSLVFGRDVMWLDARECLAAFMEGPTPSRELFFATIGSVFEKLMETRKYLVVRAYGEMVDLLWKDGNVEGALALEELWNEIGIKYSFSLLCAYSMANFFKETHTHSFRQICGHHSRVIPTEAYVLLDEDERLRQIALLQQRARALEAEIAHRKELESALRDTLAHRRRVEEALRHNEAELRDFLENANEAMHWVGPDGMILWANDAELEMLGYPRAEYIGQHVAKFHADPGAAHDMLARLGRGEELRDHRLTLVCRDHSLKNVSVNSTALFADGKFVHTRCFTREV